MIDCKTEIFADPGQDHDEAFVVYPVGVAPGNGTPDADDADLGRKIPLAVQGGCGLGAVQPVRNGRSGINDSPAGRIENLAGGRGAAWPAGI